MSLMNGSMNSLKKLKIKENKRKENSQKKYEGIAPILIQIANRPTMFEENKQIATIKSAPSSPKRGTN